MVKSKILKKENIPIICIVLLSSILNCANLNIEGYGNVYYAAGVKSMIMNLKNFFFVSFDPSGFVSIDKPPIGFWIQAMFAKIFGYSGWSIILPQAISGVVSVLLLYLIVKKFFGRIAGLISSLCLAITPIFVAVSRNNTIDNILVMCLLISFLFLQKSYEDGRTSTLILSMIFIGIGFNVKMLQSYMILPAVYLSYLIVDKINMKKKIINLIYGTIIMCIISLSWAVVVDSVPASSRPYVGSSKDNSVMELILGHNGASRFVINRDNSKDDEKPSLIRLISNNGLSNQIAYFIPLAIIGAISSISYERTRKTSNSLKKPSLLFWGTWFLSVYIFFSYTKGIFHSYYLTMIAPPIAALSGIGIVSSWKMYKECLGFKKWFLIISLIATSGLQCIVLYRNIDMVLSKIILFIIICIAAITTIILVTPLIIDKWIDIKGYKVKGALIIGIVGILIFPFISSMTPLICSIDGNMPSAGINLLKTRALLNRFSNNLSASNIIKDKNINNTVMGNKNKNKVHHIESINVGDSDGILRMNSNIIGYLQSNKCNEKYIVGAISANDVSNIIIKTGESCMAIGGFLGSDNIITLNEFKKMVHDKELRFFMLQDTKGRDVVGDNITIINWIVENGELVDGYNNLYDLQDVSIN